MNIALAFGGALSQALGDRKGIHRFGDFSAPLDEALVHVVLVRVVCAPSLLFKMLWKLHCLLVTVCLCIHQLRYALLCQSRHMLLYVNNLVLLQDLSGRPHLSYDLKIPTDHIGSYDTQLVEHFFQSVVNTSGMTLHIRQLAGQNSHHIVEATFKAFARALRKACEVDERRAGQIASSKGVLTQQ